MDSHPSPDTAARERPESVRLSEVQALRALAVVLVVVFHFWPTLVPGGYIGVDVFFAISGFLITSHLLREIDARGTVSLAGFYARRARRLLPAGLLVLLVCAIATLVFVPQDRWEQFFTEIRASTFFYENWELAHASVDYLAAENLPSPVQHYWSLSVEEQFYLVWPLLLLIGVWLTRAASRRGRRRMVVVALLGTLTLASLIFAIYDTAHDPAPAFFVTPTRVWEFGAGALLALLTVPVPATTRVRQIVSWLGFLAIAAAAMLYSATTPFPGTAALVPILATLAVIWAGTPPRERVGGKVVSARPVLFLGDVSYSLYLWHWPLLILTPFVLGTELSGVAKIGLLVVAIAAAWATKRWVEDPMRSGVLKGRRPRWTFAGAVAAMALVAVVVAYGISDLNAALAQDRERTEHLVAADPPCFGATAFDPKHQPCVNRALNGSVVPAPAEAAETGNAKCPLVDSDKLRPVCEYYRPAKDSKGTILIIGDSHAMHWRGAMVSVAKSQNVRGLSITRSNCPLTAAPPIIKGPKKADCLAWRTAVIEWLKEHPEVRTVFVSGRAASPVVAPAGVDQATAKAKGYETLWARMPASVKHVMILRDVPRAPRPSCITEVIADHAKTAEACTLPVRDALIPDPAVAAAKALGKRFGVIDMTPFFCRKKRCYAVVGGVLTHKDTHHITLVYSNSLGPYLARAVRKQAARWSR